jgi:hypothetical protein
VRLTRLWSCAHVRVPGGVQRDVTANPKRLPFNTPPRWDCGIYTQVAHGAHFYCLPAYPAPSRCVTVPTSTAHTIWRWQLLCDRVYDDYIIQPCSHLPAKLRQHVVDAHTADSSPRSLRSLRAPAGRVRRGQVARRHAALQRPEHTRLYPHRLVAQAEALLAGQQRCTAIKKLRIVRLGFGTS